MAVLLDESGTADSIRADYLSWKSERGFQVHMHRDAVEGMARELIERSQGLPVETGGLLLGRTVRVDSPVVWIERYERLECEHRSGPHFIFDRDEHLKLEQKAAELSRSSGELSVVGFYRSHLRSGFQLEASDYELTDRYFKDAEDLFLLIKPVDQAAGSDDLVAQFFIRERGEDGSTGEIRPANPSFPFEGHLTPKAEVEEDPRERTGRSGLPTVAAEAETPHVEKPQGERLGRLVPDFAPVAEPVRPAFEFLMEPRPTTTPGFTEELNPTQSFLRRRGPMLAAVLVVGGGAAVFLQQAGHRDSGVAAAVTATTAVRPLGLYVDPRGANLRISWNSSATAGARGVQLFVTGDDPSHIELSAADLASGTYEFPAKGSDVTVRLEVTGGDGRVTAESFRLVKSVEKAQAPPPVAAAPAAASSAPVRLKAIHRVAPVVPASIRPRIRGTVAVDVRVRVDQRGRVVSAVSVSKAHSGLETFLQGRAITAAREWRFETGHEGSEIIHFSFER